MARFDFEELVERLPLVVYVDKLDEKSSRPIDSFE